MSKEIKIGIDIGPAVKPDRGISIYTREILTRLNQIGPERNFKLVLLHNPDKKPSGNLLLDNAELKSHPYSDDRGPWAKLICEQFLNPIYHHVILDLDVVWHPHNRARLLNPCGYVVTLHDVLPLARPDLAGYLSSLGRKALYRTRTCTAIFADRIITASHFSREEIIRHLGVSKNKVVVIYSGVDQELFKPVSNKEGLVEVREKYLLPERYILTTGSYAPHKNRLFLAKAYERSILPKEGIGFVMVGPNNASGYRKGYEQLKAYVGGRKLHKMIRLLPSVPLEDLILLYNGAEFFTTASLYEGFGFTPLEAMACGVPVVASKTTAIPEVCGDAAYYANPNNVLDYVEAFNVLATNPSLRQSLIERGKQRVEMFDWNKTAQQTLEILMSVAMARK